MFETCVAMKFTDDDDDDDDYVVFQTVRQERFIELICAGCD